MTTLKLPVLITLFLSVFAHADVSFNAETATLYIDAAGRNGADGSSGSSSYYYSRGGNGQDGDNGSDGGDVNLSISYTNSSKSSVEVQVQIPNKGVNFKSEFSLTQLKNISIYANGGNGGDGGDGGKGADGSDGSDGWAGCPPQNGSNGSDGSDGGSGGDGGNGGRGGNIKIYVPEFQSELLMLVKNIDNSAGRAGDAGSGGRGGDGGDGGSAGSNNCEQGGSSGWDGNDGSDGRGGSSGSSGRPGQTGSHVFVVSGTSYPERYHLEVRDVVYQDENGDGIIEYGEKINIVKMKIVNTSSMPSPKDVQIVGLNGVAAELTWINAQPSLPIKSLAQGESIAIDFAPGNLELKAMDMKQFADTNTRIPLGYTKASLLGFFDQLPGASIQRLGSVTVTRPKEKMFWAQSRTIDLSIVNQSQKPIGKGTQRPVWLKVKLKAKLITAKDIKLAYNQTEALFDANNEFLFELAPLKTGANAVKLDLAVGNRTELSTMADLEFSLIRSALLPSSPSLQQVVDTKISSVSVAKDLLSEAYTFTVDVKDKIYCTFGPKQSRRRLKQITIVKQANNPNVEFNMTLARFILFKQSLPKVYQGRHDLASYLEDLNTKKLTGPKLVGFLNDYVKPGTATTLSSSQPAWVINNCLQKTK